MICKCTICFPSIVIGALHCCGARWRPLNALKLLSPHGDMFSEKVTTNLVKEAIESSSWSSTILIASSSGRFLIISMALKTFSPKALTNYSRYPRQSSSANKNTCKACKISCWKDLGRIQHWAKNEQGCSMAEWTYCVVTSLAWSWRARGSSYQNNPFFPCPLCGGICRGTDGLEKTGPVQAGC